MSQNWRQQWAQALRSADGLSPMARLVAQVLALDFANAETGQCNPSRATLARHVHASEATIKRAIADLVKGGWLQRTEGTGRNKQVSYTLRSPGKVVSFDAASRRNAGQKRPAIEAGTRVKSAPNAGQICTPPYKGRNQVKNQSARESGAVGSCPVRQAAVIEPGSHRETAWNEWLAKNGWPTVSELGVQSKQNDVFVGWRMPFAMPPNDRECIEWSISEKFVNWAAARARQRRERAG